jgi:hypothetical protein
MVKSIEVIYLQELKQVHAQQLEAQTQVLPKDDKVSNVHNVHYVVRIIIPQVLQNLKLHPSLVVILLLVLHYLNSYVSFFFVIVAFQSL